MGHRPALTDCPAVAVPVLGVAVAELFGGARMLVVEAACVADALQLYKLLTAATDRRLWWTERELHQILRRGSPRPHGGVHRRLWSSRGGNHVGGIVTGRTRLLISSLFWRVAYNRDMRVRISEAARMLGVTVDTLRRWEAAGKIEVERTPGGHRRHDVDRLRGIARHRPPDLSKRLTIGYARVSSHEQKDDLKRQAAVLSEFCARQGWVHEVIEDLGSGLNYDKKGLRLLVKRICSGEVGRLVVTHKDRLLRFGSELVFALCEQFGTEVVIINRSEDTSYEEDLVQDVLEIITVFAARLYGSRSHKNKQLVESLREMAEEMAG